jgi:hypothetical protein
MKKGLLLLVSSFLVIASMAQSEKYVKAMESKVALLDSSRTAENFKELANGFERIAEAEKTQWMPYYYAAYCQVMAGTFSMPQDGSFGDNSSISDPYADKAEQLINKAEEFRDLLC